jgi:hypothetical protein
MRGMALAAERIEDGTAVNLGTEERTRVIGAVREVMRYTGHQAEVKFLPQVPKRREAVDSYLQEMLTER